MNPEQPEPGERVREVRGAPEKFPQIELFAIAAQSAQVRDLTGEACFAASRRVRIPIQRIHDHCGAPVRPEQSRQSLRAVADQVR
jgi:hypothetical protein